MKNRRNKQFLNLVHIENQGWQAYLRGAPSNANPYKKEREKKDAWFRGWRNARNKATDDQERTTK